MSYALINDAIYALLDGIGAATVSNPGFEIAGAGGADVWANWEEIGHGTIEDETSIVHGGSHAAKFTIVDIGHTCGVRQDITVVASTAYILKVWTRGDGTNAGRYTILDNTNDQFIGGVNSTGITEANYGLMTKTFTTPVGCVSIRIDFYVPAITGAYCYFDDVSLRTIPDIGMIYNRPRYNLDIRTLRSLFISNGILHVWWIERSATEGDERAGRDVNRIHIFTIWGFYQVDDSASSEVTFQTEIDRILNILDAAYTLTSTSDLSHVATLEEKVDVEFQGVLCHRAKIRLRAEEEIALS